VIGHALVNMNRALGYRVIGINHVGDWGTTHGFILAAREQWPSSEPLTIAALNDLYVRFRDAMKQEPALEERGRAWFKRLEDGDPDARGAWQQSRDVSLAEFQQVYDRLGVAFDEVRGESEYLAAMPAVIERLAARGLSSESQGALVVALDDLGLPPLLLRKQDGATLYSTRDLAAAIYRWETYRFDRSLYVVDRGQALHFQQLFTVLERAGFEWASRCAHVPFGLVRIGGKKTGTRAGNVVLLREVLDEAEAEVRDRIRGANPELDARRVDEVARQIGVGAIVFANLVSQREKDVDFSWEDVLSFEGDAGPYVQYAHARCAAILRKAGRQAATLPAAELDVTRLAHDTEWTLAKKLIELPDVVARAAETSEPHMVCRYLLDTCGAFSRWYTAGNQDTTLRVLTDDVATAAARLALVRATQATLATGLGVLGMGAPEVM
jgi:arginyl-tRNA synthetase